MFPFYSKIKDNKKEVYNIYLRNITLFGAICFFWVLILFSYSDFFIDLLLNENWRNVSFVIKLLSIYVLFKIYCWFNGIVFISLSKPVINTTFMFIEASLMVPLVIYLTQKFDIFGTCLGVTIPSIIVSIMVYFKIKKFLEISENIIFWRISFLILLNLIFYILNMFILKIFVWYFSFFIIVSGYFLVLYFIDKKINVGIFYNLKEFLYLIRGRYEKI